MATTSKKKAFASIITPRGVLIFPKLKTPDTKFKPEGEFQAKIRLNAEDSEVFIEKTEKALKDYWPEARAELQAKVDEAKTGPAKAKAKKALDEMKEADKPYKPAYDDDGNETGEYEFNFKSPASWVKDKDKPTEKKMPIKIDLFDAKGKPIKGEVPDIWSGTVACVAGELRPFSMPIGVGISLRLKAVQIVELANGSGSKSAAGYGFGEQEGGFEADDSAPEGSFSDHSEEANEGADTPRTDEF